MVRRLSPHPSCCEHPATGCLFPQPLLLVLYCAMLLASYASMSFVTLYSCFSLDFCCLVYFDVGSVMDASKRMMPRRAPPPPPPTLSPPPPIATEAPLSSSPSSPHSPEALQTLGSPLPITAVPLAAASSPAPTPLDKGKRVLEILSDDEDSEGVAPFKRRKSCLLYTSDAADE